MAVSGAKKNLSRMNNDGQLLDHTWGKLHGLPLTQRRNTEFTVIVRRWEKFGTIISLV